jgi:nucleoid DNA-binding protein
MSKVYGQTLLDDMVRHQSLPLPLVKQAAREILAIIREGLLRDGVVNVSHFGTFRLKPVAARQGINPQTREAIIIPAHQRVIFSPCKALRELIQPQYLPPVPIQPDEITPHGDRSDPAAFIQPRAESHNQQGVERESKAADVPEPTQPAYSQGGGSAPLSLEMDKLYEAGASHPQGHYYLGSAAILVIALVCAGLFIEAGTERGNGTTTTLAATAEPQTPAPANNTAMPVDDRADSIAPPLADAQPAIVEADGGNDEASASASATPATSRINEPASDTAGAKDTAAAFFFNEQEHQIVHGESLWRLARRYYQEPLLWPHIYQANAAIIDNPDHLKEGETVVIPSLQGSAERLSRKDRQNIAKGYYLTYLHYKKTGRKEAFFALLEAKRYDHNVVETHRSLLQLSKIEQLLLRQQPTMPF